MNELTTRIQALLAGSDPQPVIWENVLREVLRHFQSETGTIHTLSDQEQLLYLVAQIGLPPQMLGIVQTIPVGKGIAGQVAAENRPVTICNLQTDTSGVARPAAKQTAVGGALCVPMRRGDKLVGTFGIGTVREYDYTAKEINQLQDIAVLVAASPLFPHKASTE
jgi:GAF domain-containing protein